MARWSAVPLGEPDMNMVSKTNLLCALLSWWTVIGTSITACTQVARAGPPTRTITVNVLVRTADGQPLDRAPIEVATRHSSEFVWSGTDGRMSTSLTPETADPELIVRLWHGEHYTLPEADRLEAKERYRAYTSSHHFDTKLVFALSAARDLYDVELVASPSISVTIAPFIASEPAEYFSVAERGGRYVGRGSRLNPVVLKGVRRGAPAELLLDSDYTNGIYFVSLTSDQTAADINLGQYEFSPPPTVVPLRVTLGNRDDAWAPGGHSVWYGVTAIRRDGGLVYSFSLHRTEGWTAETIRTAFEVEPARIAEGEFFLIPGLFGSDFHFRVLDALRAGRAAEFDAANIPKINAVAGEPEIVTTIDAQAVINALVQTVGSGIK